MGVDDFVRAFLATIFTLVAVRYTMAALGNWHRSGEERIHIGAPWSRARWVRATFNVFRVTIWAVCVLRAVWPGLDGALGLLPAPPVVALVGVGLMLASVAGIEYVHAYMERDWRSGVPADGPETLLVTGPFALIRNPLFASVMLGQVGFALALPSIFSLVCLVAGIAVLRLQVGVEERALAARFGPRYLTYCERVPRFVPRLRRAGRPSRHPVGAE